MDGTWVSKPPSIPGSIVVNVAGDMFLELPKSPDDSSGSESRIESIPERYSIAFV
jgi:hypothetical protein